MVVKLIQVKNQNIITERMKKMKKLICCMLALLMVMSVMSAAAFAAGEDTLVIYSARNERLNNIVIPAFEAKTGIKVEMITGSSGEVLSVVRRKGSPVM